MTEQMKDLRPELARNQMMGDALLSMAPDDRKATIAAMQAEAAGKSEFKIGDMIRCCQSPGISLVDGIKALPHDHNDPNQHFDSRVLGWDCFGRIEVATLYGDNPHCGDWSWSESAISRRDGPDWTQSSTFKPGMEASFQWELEGFGPEFGEKGHIHQARLVAPHIKDGDWFVEYEKANGSWITRVVNEKILRPK